MLDLDKSSLNQIKLLSIVSSLSTYDCFQIRSQEDLDSIIKNWNFQYIGLPLNQETISLLRYDSYYDWEGDYGAVYTLENKISQVSIKIHAISNTDFEFFENFYVYIKNTKIKLSYIHQLQNYLDQFNFVRQIVRILPAIGLNAHF